MMTLVQELELVDGSRFVGVCPLPKPCNNGNDNHYFPKRPLSTSRKSTVTVLWQDQSYIIKLRYTDILYIYVTQIWMSSRACFRQRFPERSFPTTSPFWLSFSPSARPTRRVSFSSPPRNGGSIRGWKLCHLCSWEGEGDSKWGASAVFFEKKHGTSKGGTSTSTAPPKPPQNPTPSPQIRPNV